MDIFVHMGYKSYFYQTIITHCYILNFEEKKKRLTQTHIDIQSR